MVTTTQNQTQEIIRSNSANDEILDHNFESVNIKNDSSKIILQQNKTMLQDFEIDLIALSKLRPSSPSADKSSPQAIASAGSTYKKLWTIQTWNVHCDAPHIRYIRHFQKVLQSTTARKIFPSVALSSSWALFLALATRQMNQYFVHIISSGALLILSYMTPPLALYLVLRARDSLSRLTEARQAWGKLVVHARTLSNIIKIHLYPQKPEATIKAARHLSMVGWMLKAYVRGESESSQRDVLKIMLEPTLNDYEWLSKQSKKSVAITSRLRQICAVALCANRNIIYTGSINLLIEEQITELESSIGTCEQLFGSPNSPSYNRELSRLVSFWMFLLPFSMLSSGLPPWGVAAAVTTGTYVLVGIEEIGMEVEDSFQLLPLQQLAASVQKEVHSQFFNNMPMMI